LLVAVLQSYSHHIVENAITDLEAHMKLIEPNLALRIGISEAEYGIRSLALLYKRAVAVMKMADRQNVLYVAYDAIGVNKLLIEIDDSTVLKRFYEQTLGLLEDYDSKNQTDYFTILRYYLMYNNSVEKVSKELFVHRNTINYKIKKIKEILQCELDYNDGVNLLLAYKIKDQIG
jgi:DNA-binding PucR family transcriptional regulator